MGIFKKFHLWRQDKERQRVKVAEAYARGCDETAASFIEQQQKMTNKIKDLSDQNIEMESALRKQADDRIKNLEKMHAIQCKDCRNNLEAERQRMVRQQGALADKMAKVDELVIRLMQHANVIIDEHDNILRSSGRIVSHRNVLTDFKREADSIMIESIPLLEIDGPGADTGGVQDESSKTKPRRTS
jgi:hypothetical protein